MTCILEILDLSILALPDDELSVWGSGYLSLNLEKERNYDANKNPQTTLLKIRNFHLFCLKMSNKTPLFEEVIGH